MTPRSNAAIIDFDDLDDAEASMLQAGPEDGEVEGGERAIAPADKAEDDPADPQEREAEEWMLGSWKVDDGPFKISISRNPDSGGLHLSYALLDGITLSGAASRFAPGSYHLKLVAPTGEAAGAARLRVLKGGGQLEEPAALEFGYQFPGQQDWHLGVMGREQAGEAGGPPEGPADEESKTMSAHEAMAASGSSQPLTEEEQRAREATEAFQRDVETEAIVDARSLAERELERHGGVRAAAMEVRIPESKGSFKKVKVELVDALNQVIGACIEDLRQHAREVEVDAMLLGIQACFLLSCHALRDLVHRHLEPGSSCYFQVFVDLLNRPKTGLRESYERWWKLGLVGRVNKAADFRKSMHKLCSELASSLQKLADSVVHPDAGVRTSCRDRVGELARHVSAAQQEPEWLDASKSPPAPVEQQLEVRLSLWGSTRRLSLTVHEDATVADLRPSLHALGDVKFLHSFGKSCTELLPAQALSSVHGVVVVQPLPLAWNGLRADGGNAYEHDPREWLASWTPLLKVGIQSGTRMLVELRTAFSDPEFQRDYNRVRKTARPGEASHVEKALEEQMKVLPKFGFEGSLKGVQDMRAEIHTLKSFDSAIRKVQLDIHRLLQFGAPMARLPIVRPLAPERFEASDHERWRAHLNDEGFVVIAGVAEAHEVNAAYRMLWDFIEGADFLSMVSRWKFVTWSDSSKDGAGWPAGKADGIIHDRGIGQAPVMWFLRGLKKLRGVFADLWGTSQLVASYDGAGVFRPYGHNPEWKTTKKNWYHVDQAHRKRGLHCVQGLLTLTDATPETGGLVVVPRSHRFHGEVLRNYREPDNGWNFLMVKANDPILTEGDGGPRQLMAKAGDLLLWDSRTVHCNTQPIIENESVLNGEDLIRAVAYICMTPAAWCSEETLKQRREGTTQRVTTSHWPHEYHAMDVPQRPGPKHSQDASQSDLVCPAAGAPMEPVMQPGSPTLIPPRKFQVAAESAPVRKTATTEWEKPIGHLTKGQVVCGHTFGRWLLLLGSEPWSPSEELEESWVSLDVEGSSATPALIDVTPPT